ncbi:hypothetical protein BSZ31_02785 [Limnobacter sp. SAORIC-690]|nr:hypothetical protein BSZ31_02785 [Limnobacter sp. SAORIC-690]
MNLIAKNWDLIIIDHLESAYACRSSNSPVVYISHNRESTLISQKIPNAPSWIQKILTAWIDHYEKKTVKTVNAVITISSDEANWYRLFNSLVIILPPTFNSTVTPVKPRKDGRLRIGFLGGSKWKPNRDAMELLLLHILPLSQRPIELVIAGSDWSMPLLQSQLQKSIGDDRVALRYMGYIDDINKFWTDVDVFAAPIANGAGVNVKVCEALSNARPVIAYPHAMRGLKGIDQSFVFLASNPIEFAQALDSFDFAAITNNPPHEFTPSYAKSKLSDLLQTIISRF